jgi:hypothetical protein
VTYVFYCIDVFIPQIGLFLGIFWGYGGWDDHPHFFCNIFIIDMKKTYWFSYFDFASSNLLKVLSRHRNFCWSF